MTREIVRYANHKIYDRAAGTYTTMKRLAEKVMAGDELAVWDDEKNMDVTVQVLTRVVYEAAKLGLVGDRRGLYRLLSPGHPWRGPVTLEDGAKDVVWLERHPDRKMYFDRGDRRVMFSLDHVFALVSQGRVLLVQAVSDSDPGTDITTRILAQMLYRRSILGGTFNPAKIVALLRERKLAA